MAPSHPVLVTIIVNATGEAMDAVSGYSMENCKAGLSFTVKFMKLRPLWPPFFDFTSKEIFSVPALVGVSVSISVALDIDAHVPSVGRSRPCMVNSQTPSLSTAET